MSIDLDQLGFTKEELQERVVDRICAQVMSGVSWDEDGEEFTCQSAFATKLNERVKKQIDDTINALAEKFVLPNVNEYIEGLTLTETNKWGESKGTTVTFIEYLTQRAEGYMREEVNYEGKAKSDGDSYSWKKSQTRVAHLIDKHLHYSISTAMEKALASAVSGIAIGLQETVKIKLAEAVAGLKVETKIKS